MITSCGSRIPGTSRSSNLASCGPYSRHDKLEFWPAIFCKRWMCSKGSWRNNVWVSKSWSVEKLHHLCGVCLFSGVQAAFGRQWADVLLKLANHALDFGVEVPLKYHGNAILSAWVRLQPELAEYYRNSRWRGRFVLVKRHEGFSESWRTPIESSGLFSSHWTPSEFSISSCIFAVS